MLQKNRAEVFKSSQNIIRAIEQGIITEMTKSRLTELENQLREIDIEISRETERNNTLLTREVIEKFFVKNSFNNTEDIKVRKLLVNTFVKEIIIYPKKIIITFNHGKTIGNTEINKDAIKQIERQSKSAFSLESGSIIYADGVPNPRLTLYA